ncbi:MAG TPA: chloride channel protein [Caulobacteraceae bacterium]|jgi:CIC family chloride channel protein
MTAPSADLARLARMVPTNRRDLASRLRSLIRGSELWLVVLAVVIGIAAGLAVALIGTLSDHMHQILFGLGHGDRLSGVAELKRGLWVPAAGGAVLGLVSWLRARRRATPTVDAVEANALHGGRMSLRDSIWVTFQTLLSNGCGASVGLEAGYAQMGAGLASRLGLAARLRRNDMRVLVGCGAGGAIGAAFGAPLTGAFYAFELIVGAYSISNVAPILAASLCGVLTARAVRAVTYNLALSPAAPTRLSDYAVMIGLGIICAALGIFIMRAVYWMERALDTVRLPPIVRPALGGVVMGGLALVTPQVLSAGHGALRLDIPAELPIIVLLSLIALKILASVVSLGSGFRGGLFFASLFLGALTGKLFAAVALLAFPWLPIDPSICILVGMASLAVAVVGGPLTMSFLVLETTGDFRVTTVVIAACMVASLVVRETFGYSFSTWRLHLRGETIRGAVDVGWVRALTVGRMMRRGPPTIEGHVKLEEFRRRHPLGSQSRVVVVDTDGHYLGVALTADAFASAEHPAEDTARTAADIARWAETPLLPDMNVKQAMTVFAQAESDALAVIDDADSRQVIGLLTESYCLRRYAEELDKARQGLSGGA